MTQHPQVRNQVRNGGAGTPRRPVPLSVHLRVHVTGLIATLLVGAIGWGVLFVVSFGTSVCNAEPTHGKRVELVVTTLAVGAVLVATAGLVGLAARRSRTVAWPWFALAAFFAVGTGWVAGTIHPAQWCFG